MLVSAEGSDNHRVSLLSSSTVQSGAHEMAVSKMKNFLSQDKGSFVSFRYACGLVGEAVFGEG